MRRLFVAIILFAMVLHSASRLDVLSYLYQQRHEIAYAIGVIAEIPIAMCSSDYDGNSGAFLVVNSDDSDSTTPPAITSAREIQLFCTCINQLLPDPTTAVSEIGYTFVVNSRYSEPVPSIFHPPA